MCNFFSHFIFVYLSKLRLHRHFTTQKKIHIGQKKERISEFSPLIFSILHTLSVSFYRILQYLSFNQLFTQIKRLEHPPRHRQQNAHQQHPEAYYLPFDESGQRLLNLHRCSVGLADIYAVV